MEVEAGLPNITGWADILSGKGWYPGGSGGSLSLISGTKAGVGGENRYGGLASGVNLNASSSSQIYKNDVTTVQPASIRCYIWQRVT